MKEHKTYKTIFQREENVDAYEIGDTKKVISWAEFEKLQSLMPGTNWIIVRWGKLPNKPGRTHLDFNDAK
jgi:hypothetical protein